MHKKTENTEVVNSKLSVDMIYVDKIFLIFSIFHKEICFAVDWLFLVRV